MALGEHFGVDGGWNGRAERRGELEFEARGEGDEAAVEGGIVEGVEAEAVGGVEARLWVGGPGSDVAGAEEGGTGDICECAAAAP